MINLVESLNGFCYSVSYSLRLREIGVREDPHRHQGPTQRVGLKKHVPDPNPESNPAPESRPPQGQRVTTVAEQQQWRR